MGIFSPIPDRRDDEQNKVDRLEQRIAALEQKVKFEQDEKTGLAIKIGHQEVRYYRPVPGWVRLQFGAGEDKYSVEFPEAEIGKLIKLITRK